MSTQKQQSGGKARPRKRLVIVESPAKARTIKGFLGDDFVVESSIGHIRDLPKRASDIPAAYKKEAWARLGVDVDNDFRPLYVIDPDKKAHIGKLKEMLKGADELYLATDEDREGESIAWHLLEVLSPRVPVKRMVFHEITRPAIMRAIESPREVDRRLVDAQEARRILDRLYGYEVSPVLWKKIMPRLSAGRVQSVATRMIVEREAARMRFRPASYWGIEGALVKPGDAGGEVPVTLSSVGGARVATGKDFDESGKLTKGDLVLLDEAAATKLAASLSGGSFVIKSVERKPNRRSPAPPFMTSTLQQEAGRKLRFSAARAMQVAQRLYEAGYITYMRTDSTTLSDSAVESARDQIKRMYGADYLPDKPRVYAKKVKNAQEAHEAIRPAGDVFRKPEEVSREVGADEARLYELIWMRTIASQMPDARGETVSVKIAASGAGGEKAELSASGNTIVFPGFLRAYVEGSDDPTAELENKERPLPILDEGQALDVGSLTPRGHETQPPARFTEASLVRQLEELGVGRPSTYATIISTILERGYVWKRGAALVPSFKAFAVVALLEQHFGDLVDYAFTARMEDELDAIAQGDAKATPWLHRFYFGDGEAGPAASGAQNGKASLRHRGLRSLVADQLGDIDARAINSLSLGTDTEGREVIVRVGRYGPYLQRGDDTASLPDELPPDELTVAKATELLEAPSGDRRLGDDPATGLPVFVRTGRYGSYAQLGEAGADAKEKPKTSSLLRSMTPETVTLEDALKVLSLPRVVGEDPSDGQPITAQLGRYGPYIQKGKESRSLESEEQVFSVDVEQALALLAQPRRMGRRAAAEPIKTLGDDDVSGQPITLREGRFGLYVTDGETNASLRREDSAESLTLDRARELLQMRRDRGPVDRKRRGPARGGKKSGGGSNKAAAKSATPKAAAKKPAAKKPAAKKPAAKKPAAKKPAAKKPAAKKSAGAAGSGSKRGAAASPKPGKQPPGKQPSEELTGAE